MQLLSAKSMIRRARQSRRRALRVLRQRIEALAGAAGQDDDERVVERARTSELSGRSPREGQMMC